jgi:hypothetical protein
VSRLSPTSGAIVVVSMLVASCGSDRPPPGTAGGAGGLPGSGSSDAGIDGRADGGTATQCTNGIDDDGDGRIDSDDPECTGPLDDDEATYGNGIAGDNSDPCKQDCTFDGNSGQGNDGCERDLACDPLKPGGATCEKDAEPPVCNPQPDLCLKSCLPLTPNGCDCFGCCSFPFGAGIVSVRLTKSCNSKSLDDVSRCIRCTPVADCKNDCATCELCTNRRELPPECGAKPVCPAGETPCKTSNDCAPGDYCLTGCCKLVVR